MKQKTVTRLDYKGQTYLCQDDFKDVNFGDTLMIEIVDIDDQAAEIKRLKDALDYCCEALDIKIHCEEFDKTCEGINSALALLRNKCIEAAPPQKGESDE